MGLGQPPHKDIAFLLQRKVWGQNTFDLYQQDNMLGDVEISDPVFKNIVGDFAGFLLLSCICSHSIIEWGQKFKLSLERCFHCRLNWTDYFTPISPPPCRQPIPTGLLFLPLWLYCALPPGLLTMTHARLGNTGTLQNHSPDPPCLLVRSHMHLYSISTPLIYYYHCGFYC